MALSTWNTYSMMFSSGMDFKLLTRALQQLRDAQGDVSNLKSAYTTQHHIRIMNFLYSVYYHIIITGNIVERAHIQQSQNEIMKS